MFTRSIELELIKWKESPYRKPLILRGARQVGKTSVVRNFAEKNFHNLVEINLEKKEHYDLFNQAKSVDDFIRGISLFLNQSLIPGSTLLFIDEIQESKNVLELLRFFAEEKPELHVITAGSLLEALLDKDLSFPVGRVDYLFLSPMTFFEYLSARNKSALKNELESISLGQKYSFGDQISSIYKEYILIGGMPEAVKSYIETGNYDQTKTILNRYQIAFTDDIHKYAKSTEQIKFLELVIDQGPKLAGNLFKYEGFGGSNFRSREMSEAVHTIEKAMLLRQIPATNSSALPIAIKLNRPKKMIWLDTGIVNHANQAYFDLIKGEYGGKLMEQIVGQSLIAWGVSQPMNLNYWSLDRDEGSAEVDFCFQLNSRFVGLEIKSGNTNKMKSLFSLGNRDKNAILVRVSWDDLNCETWKFAEKEFKVLSLPFYLLDRGQELIAEYINAK